MPDPKSDRDQLRFAQIRERLLNGITKNMPSYYVEASDSQSRKGFREKLMESDLVLHLLECCAYEVLCMEEERGDVRRP